MSHIDKTISRLPTMSAKALTTLRANANAVLARKPDAEDARRLLDALDAMEAVKLGADRFRVTDLLLWGSVAQIL